MWGKKETERGRDMRGGGRNKRQIEKEREGGGRRRRVGRGRKTNYDVFIGQYGAGSDATQ